MGSPSEDDSPRSGPASGGVGSGDFWKGLGGVGPPVYGFNQNLFTFCGRVSPARVPSVNVQFSAVIIQTGPVQGKRSLLGVLPMRVWNMSTTLPIANNFSFRLRCRSTKTLQHCWSSSRIARLWTHVSPRARSCCRRTRSEASSGIRSFTCMRRLRIWNSTGIMTSNPCAKRNGVACTLVLKLVWKTHSALLSFVS